MSNLARQTLPHMTAEDFLAWTGDRSGRTFEAVDGEVRAVSPLYAGAMDQRFVGDEAVTPQPGVVLRWLDHERPRRPVQGRPRQHGLVIGPGAGSPT
jgi:hypothetical protein